MEPIFVKKMKSVGPASGYYYIFFEIGNIQNPLFILTESLARSLADELREELGREEG